MLAGLIAALRFTVLFELSEQGIDIRENTIAFSKDSGFYTDDIEIAATATNTNARIYYTVDGSEPNITHKKDMLLYDSPILLKATDKKVVARVLKFIACDENGNASPVYTNTYFMGKYVNNRFDTLILSLSTDADNLYGYENGIFVEGKLRDDYVAEHPDEELKYSAPANYNVRGPESERNVHIEVFEPDGTRILSQDGGIRTAGNFTRGSEQKSFKLYARSQYDEQGKFAIPFFEDAVKKEDGTIFKSYECLKIRNTGNDRMEAFIRDELAMRLAGEADMQDTQLVRPVSVYINGAYNGCYWMHSTYDDEYFKERYGKYEGDMVVIGSGEMEMETDTNDEQSNQYAAEYTDIYNTYSARDLTDDHVFTELQSYIDIDNYLKYYAIEILMVNQDWPFNNEKAYRYVDPKENYTKGTVFDGRYRYLLYDADTTMGHGYIADNIGEDESFEILEHCLDPERNYAPLFAALLKREDCRKQFVLDLCDLMNGALSYENVCRTLDNMQQERENEMTAYIDESLKNDELMDISDYYIHMQMDCIKAWAKVTPPDMYEHLAGLWSDLGTTYRLQVFLPKEAEAVINSVKVDGKGFDGTYFTENQVKIKAVAPQGKQFAYWRINGKKEYSKTLTVTEDMIQNGKIFVSLYLRDDQAAGLEIHAICAKGTHDFFMLKNNTFHDIDTKGYYVKDKDKASHVYYLPERQIQSGESVRINCSNCLEDAASCLMQVGFSLSDEDILTLGCDKMGDVEAVKVPHLSVENGIYCKSELDGTWTEKARTQSNRITVKNLDE